MLGTIYIGLSGMSAYSKGLDVISNNVANLNTPGFKLTDPAFSDALYRNGGGAIEGSSGTKTRGAGVSVDTGQSSFRQGELRDTGNPLDVGVDGNGFFALDRQGERLFTRAGQFEFNGDGVLVDRTTGASVVVSTDTASNTSFDLDNYRVDLPKATKEVTLVGSLARTSTSTATYDLSNIVVIDASGARQTLKAKFVRDASNLLKWNVEVSDASNTLLGSGVITFNDDGTPAANANVVKITVKAAGQPDQEVALNFGAAGKFSGVTSISSAATSAISIQKQDGIERGTLTATTFDDRGRLTLTYSNGQKRTPATLLLGQFDSSEQLDSRGSGIYAPKPGITVALAAPQTEGRGTISAGKVEMSNVDLTQQFTDLIIVQRGYQASSQVTSVANEMIQQLLSMSNKT